MLLNGVLEARARRRGLPVRLTTVKVPIHLRQMRSDSDSSRHAHISSIIAP